MGLSFDIIKAHGGEIKVETKKGETILVTHSPLESSGGYDYLTVDSVSEKLYVSHGSQVNILNMNKGDSIGAIKTEKDVHGIALVSQRRD